MRTSNHSIVIGALLVAGVVALSNALAPAANERAAIAPAPRVGGVLRILSATPFELAAPTEHAWRAGAPQYTRGWMLALEVDPDFAAVRQVAEPVLYGGHETLERVASGAKSAHVIAILPASGGVRPDLARTSFWYGAAALPEQITIADVEHEAAHAASIGVRPFDAAEIAAARARGGDELVLDRRDDLDTFLGALVLELVPEEHDLGRYLISR